MKYLKEYGTKDYLTLKQFAKKINQEVLFIAWY